MADIPNIDELEKALSEAGSAHHDFEVEILNGVRDEIWHGFYAAYVLGKLGNFTKPSLLSRLLESTPESDNWAKSSAEYIIGKLSK